MDNIEYREFNKEDELQVLKAYKEILSSEHEYGYDKFSGAYCLKKLSTSKYSEFLEYLEYLKNRHNDESSQTLFGLFINNELVGFGVIRWDDNYKTLNYQGHVGALIRPSKRGHKYAETILKLSIKELFKSGKENIIVSSKPKNISSYKTLEHGGMEFKNEYEKDGQIYLVYKINRKKILDIV